MADSSHRLLPRLEAAIAATRPPIDRAVLRASRAALLARLGRLDEAAAETAALHGEFDDRPDPRVSAGLGIAEALADWHRDLDEAARDRLRRAHALAVAARLRGAQALAAAWLAHLAYVRHDPPAMVRHLDDALSAASEDDHGARGRATLVVAQALHWAGDARSAVAWYTRARRHAQADGDEAAASALMHNLAWLRGVQARQARLWSGLDPTQTPQGPSPSLAEVQAGADAAEALDRLAGNRSLPASLPLLSAMLAVDREDWAAGLAALDALRDDAAVGGFGRWLAWIEADRAWCRLQVGGDVRAAVAAAQAAVGRQPEPDDRAMTAARLAAVAQALGDHAAAEAQRAAARADIVDHRQRQQAMREVLAPVLVRHAA
jgi:hypothetical protein